MFSFFRRKPAPLSLERQLAALAECGIELSPGVTNDDLIDSCSREALEKNPFQSLIPALGQEVEREPFMPFSPRLWLCDFECIDDSGAYVDIVTRLHEMSGRCLPISGIAGHVDHDGEEAWVAFDLGGTKVRWEADCNDDWLDPSILVRFDRLLKSRNAPCRLYYNQRDFGQGAFLACLTPGQFGEFQKLATFKLREIPDEM